jgi:hypothetical protein
MKQTTKYLLPFTGKRRADRVKTVVQLTAVLLALALVFALSFAGCKGSASPSRDVVWIGLRPTTLDDTGEERTATLLLDFSEPIAELDDRNTDLNLIFSFGYVERPEGEGVLKAKTISRTAGGMYTLTIRNVPESGIVVVKINKAGVTPAARLWNVAGLEVAETDVTPVLLDYRFEPGKNPSFVSPDATDAVAGIDQRLGTVMVVVPLGADRSALNPTIKTNLGNTYTSTPPDATDFTEAVPYRVVSAVNGDHKDYKVTVFPQTAASARIYHFGFTSEHNIGLADTVSGVID